MKIFNFLYEFWPVLNGFCCLLQCRQAQHSLPAHPCTQMLTFLSVVKYPCLFYGLVILRLEDCWAWKRSLTPACYLAINKFGVLWTGKYSGFLLRLFTLIWGYQQTGWFEAFKEKQHASLAKESKKHLNINNSTLSQKDKIKICRSF